MRKLTTLYQIVYDRVNEAPEGTYVHICNLLGCLRDDSTITFDEFLKIKVHLYKNKPSEWKHIEFIADCAYDCDSFYWWPIFEWEQRKLFLKKMIQISKPWYKQIPYLWNQLRSIERL